MVTLTISVQIASNKTLLFAQNPCSHRPYSRLAVEVNKSGESLINL